MIIRNYYPDPRFVHLNSARMNPTACTLSAWSSCRGVDVRPNMSEEATHSFFNMAAFTIPANTSLYLNCTVEVKGAEPDLSWSHILLLYDPTIGSGSASGWLAGVSTSSASTIHHLKFTSPSDGRVRLQGVVPRVEGAVLKVSQVSITDEEGYQYMLANNLWWLHGNLMPLS